MTISLNASFFTLNLKIFRRGNELREARTTPPEGEEKIKHFISIFGALQLIKC